MPSTLNAAGMAGLISCLSVTVATIAQAQMDMGSMQGGSAPHDARDPHAYAEGAEFTQGADRPVLMDHHRFRTLRIDQLELSRVDGETIVPFDLEAWLGHAYDRAVLEAEGELENGDLAGARSEVHWAHAIAPFWDSRLGVRYDSGEGPNRAWLAAGVEGLAPYRFDLQFTGYVGESNRTALRIDAAYDVLMTQRLILEPRFEANFYGKEDVERGLGTGLADAALGLRLRYEIRRELAPYIGVEWKDEFGGTEELSRAAGSDPSDARIAMGIRFWF